MKGDGGEKPAPPNALPVIPGYPRLPNFRIVAARPCPDGGNGGSIIRAGFSPGAQLDEEFMRKIIIMLAALLLAGAANTPEREAGQWQYECIDVEITGWRMCGILYFDLVPRAQSEVIVTLSITGSKDHEPDFLISVSERGSEELKFLVCLYRNAVVRVDGAEVAKWENEAHGYSGYLVRANVRAVTDRFLTGNSAVLTLHLVPGCTPYDLPVSLEGFPEAWREFQEEIR